MFFLMLTALNVLACLSPPLNFLVSFICLCSYGNKKSLPRSDKLVSSLSSCELGCFNIVDIQNIHFTEIAEDCYYSLAIEFSERFICIRCLQLTVSTNVIHTIAYDSIKHNRPISSFTSHTGILLFAHLSFHFVNECCVFCSISLSLSNHSMENVCSK